MGERKPISVDICKKFIDLMPKLRVGPAFDAPLRDCDDVRKINYSLFSLQIIALQLSDFSEHIRVLMNSECHQTR